MDVEEAQPKKSVETVKRDKKRKREDEDGANSKEKAPKSVKVKEEEASEPYALVRCTSRNFHALLSPPSPGPLPCARLLCHLRLPPSSL